MKSYSYEEDPRKKKCFVDGMPWVSNCEKEWIDEVREKVEKKGLRIKFGPAPYIDCKTEIPYLIGVYSDLDPKEYSPVVFGGFYGFDRENYKKRRVYTGSLEDVVDLVQQELGITNSKDKKPVIATSCLTNCVGITGYNKENKAGFLIHADAMTHPILPVLVGSLGRLTPEKQVYGVHLIGGQSKGEKRHINRIIDSLTINNLNEKIRFEIVEKDLYGEDMKRNIALDTRTGEIFDYNASINGRDDLCARMMLCGFSLNLGVNVPPTLAYFPEELKLEERK